MTFENRLTTTLSAIVLLLCSIDASAKDQMNKNFIDDDVIASAVEQLKQNTPKEHHPRLEAGVQQVARLWRQSDGTPHEFQRFCLEQFQPTTEAKRTLLARMDSAIEALFGHRVALTRRLREPADLEIGPQTPVDSLLASLDPFDHLLEDLFTTKVAFASLLNFPRRSLDELTSLGTSLPREEWAAARLIKLLSLRIPGALRQAETMAFRSGEDYISSYNILMGCLVDSSGTRLFPKDMSLISHWGLRDEIRALYSDPAKNLPKQQLIFTVMNRIIRQEIPEKVVNSCELDWNPVDNTVAPHQEGNLTNLTPFEPATPEPDRRYETLLKIFHAQQQIDPWSPDYPTYIQRRFLIDRELSEERVEQLLTAVVSSKEAAAVGKIVAKRLGRPLQPFDIWFDGFKNRSLISADELDAATRQLYPTADEFQKAIPGILTSLGFSSQTADYLANHIAVDAARGSGHAMGAGMRSDSAHLRTRVKADGMDYKGYNIAIHELGHNVEQVLSLNKVDHVLMAGVPNTAFTEAFAFLFQARDLELLGRGASSSDKQEKTNRLLDLFWSTYEISGVALLDMQVWRWMYANPNATPAQLKEAVVQLATELWNRYYAPVFGVKDSPILAIYSHMIDAGLYLPDYPLGFLVTFQIERFIQGKNLGQEMERMCIQGALAPDVWMKGAVGTQLSAQPLLDAVAVAAKEALQ